MTTHNQGANRIGVILLAAGYGTRLARDIANAPSFAALANTPKPLLPLGGRVLLSHWVHTFSAVSNLAAIVVVTNDAHLQLYKQWGSTLAQTQQTALTVVSDGTTSNENRVGAVAAMRIGVDALPLNINTVVIVAGDTLLPAFDAAALVAQFHSVDASAAICAYSLRDPADCVRRGMLRVDADSFATELVEKPASVAESPSNLACAPIYFLRNAKFDSFKAFLDEHVDKPLKQRDAPGFWVRWVIPRVRTYVLRVTDRIDIGGLPHYRDALSRFSSTGARVGRLKVLPRLANEPAIGRAAPRAGLLGNPSDGYGGKTISIALASEGYAEVMAVASLKFSVAHNPAHELPTEFDSIHELSSTVSKYGVNYGARQLVIAAAASFAKILKETSINGETADVGSTTVLNCHLTYTTTIPVRLGLAGSSALILATFRALARFYNTSLYRLNPIIELWPLCLLKVERDMLGIASGLQDRVAQMYQGCMYMDFSSDPPRYTRLDHSRLPPLWIAYRSSADSVGECSGKVHSNLGARYRVGDPEVLSGMTKLGAVAEKGRGAILGDIKVMPELFRKNFALRLQLVGEDVVGEDNMACVGVAEKAGFAAKLCGSGGAIICVSNSAGELNELETKRAHDMFSEAGFVLRRVEVLPDVVWSEE